MSLFNFFQPVKDKAKGTCSDVGSKASSLSNKDKNGILREELMIIQEELEDIDDNNETATSNKRTVYKELAKIRIARYACENGNSRAVSMFKNDFP